MLGSLGLISSLEARTLTNWTGVIVVRGPLGWRKVVPNMFIALTYVMLKLGYVFDVADHVK